MLWKRIIVADSAFECMAGDFGILKSKKKYHAKHHTLGQFSCVKPGRSACESMSVRRYLPSQAGISIRSRRVPVKCMCSTNIALSCVHEMCMYIVAIASSVHYMCNPVCSFQTFTKNYRSRSGIIQTRNSLISLSVNVIAHILFIYVSRVQASDAVYIHIPNASQLLLYQHGSDFVTADAPVL